MITEASKYYKFDWISIILFLILTGFGWLNIVSASHTGETVNYLDFSQPYGKQLVFILFTFLLIIIILAIESKFYERFSSVIYIVSMLSLVGLFIFGKNVNGATSWYGIGGMTIQPSEFAKAATALAVAKYVSDLNTDIQTIKDQIGTFAIIAIPAILVLLQKDAGSTLVYAGFIFVLYREGLSPSYLIILFSIVLISLATLKFGVILTSLLVIALVLGFHYTRRRKPLLIQSFSIIVISILMSVGVRYFYDNLLPFHQKDRITIWLSLENDPEILERMKKTIAYNLNESEKAISSGGLTGKGFLEGTRTTGKFVPEQHTDYIFSTVGEEWGFIGSVSVVIVFILLILRILYLAELQRSQFSRMYGYGVASIFFMHFFINIGMVMGVIPTIGIPLPMFSYGGSGLWGFAILLFIFIKLDSDRINQW